MACGIPALAAVSDLQRRGLRRARRPRCCFGVAGRPARRQARADRRGLLVQALRDRALSLRARARRVLRRRGGLRHGLRRRDAALRRAGARILRQRIMGTVFGAATLLSSLGMSLGPAVGGWIFDTFGTYGWLYLGSAALAVGAVMISLFFPPVPRRGGVARPSPVDASSGLGQRIGRARASLCPVDPLPRPRDPRPLQARGRRGADRANAGLDRFVPAIPESAAFAFVLGCGHSGTTLVASRLGNHPAVALIPEETNIFEPRRPLGRARRFLVAALAAARARGAADGAGEDAEARAGHRAAAPAAARGAADRGGAQSARHLPVAPETRRHARGGDRPLVRRQRGGAVGSPAIRWRASSITRS